jgi:hypothetical protein
VLACGAQSPQGMEGVMTELVQVLGAEVGQFMVLQMPPQILDRIEFRSAGGKPLQLQSTLLSGYELSHQPAAVTRSSVPDHQQRARQVTQQDVRESR